MVSLKWIRGLASTALLSACMHPQLEQAFRTPFELSDHEWERVFDDESYTVSIDIVHVSPGPIEDSLEVWYETRHKTLRRYEGHPWNREVIRSQLRCDPLSFRTVLTTIFLEHGAPVAQVGPTTEQLESLDWREVGPGSVDEAAFIAACVLLRQEGYLIPAA